MRPWAVALGVALQAAGSLARGGGAKIVQLPLFQVAHDMAEASRRTWLRLTAECQSSVARGERQHR